MRSLLSLLCAMVAASAVETPPVPILGVVSGDTIEVEADIDGTGTAQAVRVHLAWIAVPQPGIDSPLSASEPDNTREVLDAVCHEPPTRDGPSPKWGRARLWAPGERFRRDAIGRVEAIVYRALDDRTFKHDLNGLLVAAGLAAYVASAGELPAEERDRFEHNSESAQRSGPDGSSGSGLWGTHPQWMRDHVDGRPAAKAEGR
jgi:endonuclease YncB( thermonuclease family)